MAFKQVCSGWGRSWFGRLFVALTLICGCFQPRGASAAGGQHSVYGEGVDPLNATPTQREQAQTIFKRGKELFDAGQFEQARVEFSASRAIVASPNTRLYIARCLVREGHKAWAYSLYGRTVVEALELAAREARYSRTADAARLEREELAGSIGYIKLNIEAPRDETELIVNDELIRRAAWSEPMVVDPGTVTVVLRSTGFHDVTRSFDVAAGQTVESTLSLGEPETPVAAEPPPPSAPLPARQGQDHKDADLMPYVIGAGAVGLAGFGAFGYFGTKSEATYDDLTRRCPDGTCGASQQSRIDAGERQQLFANLGLVLGALGTASAVTLWVLDGDDTGENTALVLTGSGLFWRGKL